jgi:hypothetical protein
MPEIPQHMLKRVQAAANLLPVEEREPYVRSVSNRVAAKPGFAELENEIKFVLENYGVMVGPR